jgi:hypothetical protein
MKLVATSFVLAALDSLDETATEQWTDCAAVSAAVARKNPQGALGTFLNTMSTLGWLASSSSSTATQIVDVPGVLKTGDGASLATLLRLLKAAPTQDISNLFDWWWQQAAPLAVAIAGVNASIDGNLVAEVRGFVLPSFTRSVVTAAASLEVTVTRCSLSFNAQVYNQVEQSLAAKAGALTAIIHTADVAAAAAG